MAAVTTSSSETAPWRWSLESVPEGIVLHLSGSWRMEDGPPPPALVEAEGGDRPPPSRLGIDGREVTAGGSGVPVFGPQPGGAGGGPGHRRGPAPPLPRGPRASPPGPGRAAR